MLPAHDIYADQLRDLMMGQPLYYPEPSEGGPLEIGDVGFIMEGAFYRLFNAARPANDPTQLLGVPEGFTPLDIGRPRVFEAALEPGPLCSKTIVLVHTQVEAADSVLPANASFRFSCTSSQGAVLMLETQMRRDVAPNKNRFKNYAEKHGHSWHQFAKQEGFPVRFVYSQGAREFGIAFHAGGTFVPAVGGVTVSAGMETIRSMGSRRSQTGGLTAEQLRDALKDQTVFIKGYHVGLRSYYRQSIFCKIMRMMIGEKGRNLGERKDPQKLSRPTQPSFADTTGSDQPENLETVQSDSLEVWATLPDSPDFKPAVALLAYEFETTNVEILAVHDNDWCSGGDDDFTRAIQDVYSQHFFGKDLLKTSSATDLITHGFSSLRASGSPLGQSEDIQIHRTSSISNLVVKTYFFISDMPQSVWKSLQSREHQANTILPVMLKARKLERDGRRMNGHAWITVGSASAVELVLSVSDGPMGAYPIFIFSALSENDLTETNIRPRVIMLINELLKAVPMQRVFSIFAPELLTIIFAEEWTKATSITTVPEPYCATMISFCTLSSLSSQKGSVGLPAEHTVRLGNENDIDEIGKLCFLHDSDLYLLTQDRAREEARILIRERQVWVYAVSRNGQDDIVCIVAVTRKSENVATITKVATSPSWRRRGCAESLVRRVCEHLLSVEGKEKVVIYVAHDNLPAVHLFNRVGFLGLDGEAVRGVEPWMEIGFDRTKVELGHW